jgi:ABC-type Fe3+ transport system permease subunit
MLGKILITIIIVLLGLVWIRKIREQERRDAGQSRAKTGEANTAAPPHETLNDFRFAAYLFLALMLGTGAYLYYDRWQDEHSLVTVILHRDGNQSPVSYQVQKSELGERAFTTIEGVRVTVASSERMEVIGL